MVTGHRQTKIKIDTSADTRTYTHTLTRSHPTNVKKTNLRKLNLYLYEKKVCQINYMNEINIVFKCKSKAKQIGMKSLLLKINIYRNE